MAIIKVADLGISSGVNTPAFYAYLNTEQTIPNDTTTKITLNTELFDTHNAFDSSTNYRFTAPSGYGGYYSINAQLRSASDSDFDHVNLYLRKNGSDLLFSKLRNENQETLNASAVVSLSVGDYVELFVYHARGTSMGVAGSPNYSTFLSGHKLIGT